MRFGVILPGGTAVEQLEQAVLAEEAGWDGVFVWEAAYGVDAWGLLTAIAARTERIRLGTMLTPLPWRRPWKVASQVVTLDQISSGRATLASGSARSRRICPAPARSSTCRTAGGDDGRGHRPDPRAVGRTAAITASTTTTSALATTSRRWAARCRSGSRSGWWAPGRDPSRCGASCAATAYCRSTHRAGTSPDELRRSRVVAGPPSGAARGLDVIAEGETPADDRAPRPPTSDPGQT